MKEDDNMNLCEEFKKSVEDNQTRKIIDIIRESKTLKEAEEKVKALLHDK